MTDREDGGAAYPFSFRDAEAHPLEHRSFGMSLRDWFAGQALPAVISATSAGRHTPAGVLRGEKIDVAIAMDAYAMADAMLEARETATGAA